MKPFDIAEAFMEQHARGMPLPELKQAFENSLPELGIRHFACCSHVRGAAIVDLGSVTHRAGANHGDKPRAGLIFSYCLGWLKQYENAYLTYPPDVARHFAKPLRELLGYRIHRPNLGGTEGQDPSVLFEGRSHTLAAVDAISAATAAESRHFYESA